MSAIRLNGQYVLLRDVEKKDFLAFVQLCLPKITAEEPVPHTMANVLAGLLAEGKPTDLMRKFRQDSLENVFLRLCETRADPESGFDSANPAAAPRDPMVCVNYSHSV